MTLPDAPRGELPPQLDWSIETLEALPNNCVELDVGNGIFARLRRFRSPAAKHSVLLVHGASAGSRTFMIPNGGLIEYLVSLECDVWTLDWRSSNLFTQYNPEEVRRAAIRALADAGNPGSYWRLFNLDTAAECDLAKSLQAIGEWTRQEQSTQQPPAIAVMAHCVGAAVVTQALATGLLTQPSASYRLRSVVLSTLGLFYRVGLEGWLKGNEFLLEELATTRETFADPEHPVITPVLEPGAQWPQALENAFQAWRQTPFAPNGWGGKRTSEFVERIAFMYGMPYHTKRLAGMSVEALKLQFGDMPLGVYMHCVRNLRIGYAAAFEATERHYVSAQHLLRDGVPVVPITLLTGAENQVWHRDSIDRTYEWLVNQTAPHARRLLEKRVFTGYAHQDLLWCDESPHTIYPKIATGLLTHGQSD